MQQNHCYMFFFTSKCSVLPWTNQTNKYGDLMSNHEFNSFWFCPEVTKSEDIQATQQLNFTNELGDKRKAESQPEVFAGKGKRDRKYQMSWERDFPGLVQDEENNTMKCKICFSFPEIADKSSSLFIGNGERTKIWLTVLWTLSINVFKKPPTKAMHVL